MVMQYGAAVTKWCLALITSQRPSWDEKLQQANKNI